MYNNATIRVPVPKDERVIRHTNKAGGYVSVELTVEYNYNRITGNTSPSRITLGRVCDDDTTKMFPSSRYKEIYPSEWEKYSGEKVPPAEKNFGMYAGVRAIISSTGLGDILEAVFGKAQTNAILDYAMFSMLNQSDSSVHFENAMIDEVLFSGETLSDSYYSELFEHKMTRGKILDFKVRWAKKCKEDGVEEVWLCIDGSNDDCKSEGVCLAEHGHAKSHKNVDIVSFTYAITSEGKPVTFDVYRGGLVDAKAMKSIIDFLGSCGIKVKGVILDRGYCDQKAIQYLHDKGISYLIMIKGAPQGYQDVVKQYSSKIKLNVEYLVNKTCLFAAQDEVKLYDGLSWKDTVTLFYDYANGGERISSLLAKVFAEIEKVNDAVENGKKVKICKDLSSVIQIDPETGKADINKEGLQESINHKGEYGIVCSEELPAEQIHSLYVARGGSETLYMLTKTQLGYGVLRVHLTAGVRSKFAEAFITSIIRYEIEHASKTISRTAREGIRELDLMVVKQINVNWIHSETETKRGLSLIQDLSGENGTSYLNGIADGLNKRGRAPVFRRRKAGVRKESPDPNAETKKKMPRQKPGPKPGYKRGTHNADGSVRKKPGPKPGSKKGMYNKDGTLRNKPGPKPRVIQEAVN